MYVANRFRIHEFLRKNPPDFIGSNVIKNLEKYVEKLQKEFEVNIEDAEHVELVAYQLKGVARVWYEQWKKCRVEGAPIVRWIVF